MAVSEVVEMRRVRLNSARVGHVFNDKGQFAGEFAQAAGDEVEMTVAEAERHCLRGLASPIANPKKN